MKEMNFGRFLDSLKNLGMLTMAGKDTFLFTPQHKRNVFWFLKSLHQQKMVKIDTRKLPNGTRKLYIVQKWMLGCLGMKLPTMSLPLYKHLLIMGITSLLLQAFMT